MKRLIILNPQSRNGSASRLFEQQREDLENLLGEFEVYQTAGPGDATEKVRSVLQSDGADQILIAGGDGSINEAFCGYWDGSEIINAEIPLGILNFGTGGDFYRTVQASSETYAESLRRNRFRLVDAAAVTDLHGARHPFLNIASVGLAGDMLQRLKKSRFQAGAVAYFYHSLRTLLEGHPKHAEIEIIDREGRPEKFQSDFLNFFVCNGQFSGGGMQWAPAAKLDSGLIEVTLIEGPRKWPLVWHSRKLYAGRIESFPGARTFQARRVTMRCAEPISLETDGEIVEREEDGESEIRFEVIPEVFPLIL